MDKYSIDLSCLPFQRNLKNLKKKFPSVKDDVEKILTELEKGEPLGEPIPLINAPVYKVRVRNTDIPKGESSGYRLIYKFDEEKRVITPLLIYFKGDKAEVFRKEIESALESLEKSLFDEI